MSSSSWSGSVGTLSGRKRRASMTVKGEEQGQEEQDQEWDGKERKREEGRKDDLLHFKLLIPCLSSGAVIGKGGENIERMQREVKVKVKMSKEQDFYPGTNERVCLVYGKKEGIQEAVEFIAEKIRERPDPSSRAAMDFDNKVAAERDKQVKAIVPNSTASKIIGKAGSTIKTIKEVSGAFVQLSQKSKDSALNERVVTVIGEPHQNRKAVEMILEQVSLDPQSGSCINISYAESQPGAVANFNPTGSPFAQSNAQTSNQEAGQRTAQQVTLGPLSLKFNFPPARSQPSVPNEIGLSSHILSQVHGCLCSSGFNQRESQEISQALNCLATHGVLVVGQQIDPPPEHRHPRQEHQVLSLQPMATANLAMPTNPAHHGQGAVVNQIQFQGPEGAVVVAQHYHTLPTAVGTTGHVHHQAAVAEESQFDRAWNAVTGQNNLEEESTAEMEIDESIIGAVIGPMGRSIAKIEKESGTKIKISKKGVFAPGTRNRTVKITSNDYTNSREALAKAKWMIEQTMLREESNRELEKSSNPFC